VIYIGEERNRNSFAGKFSVCHDFHYGGEFMKRLGLMAVVFWAAGICFAPSVFAIVMLPSQYPATNSDYISFTGVTYEAGQGFGAVTNLLTLQADTEEAGSITPTGGVDLIGGAGTVKNSSQTYTVGELKGLGFTGENLLILLNLGEPGKVDQQSGNLLFFSLDFYDSTGALIGNTLTTGVPINGILPSGGFGTGTDGYIMPYTDNGFLASIFSNDNNIIGGTGYLSDTSDGQDNFVLAQGMPTSVPEPTTLLLLGLGLVGIGMSRKFRR
jgi:hypothetical protein